MTKYAAKVTNVPFWRAPDGTPCGSDPCGTGGRQDSCRLLDDPHLMGGLVRPPSAFRSNGHDVFNPNAVPPRKIDAGFNGKAHAGVQSLGFALHHVRRLMGCQPDPVPDAVDEVFAVAGVGNHRPGCTVDLLAFHARPHGLESRLLGLPDDVVNLAFLGGGLANMHRPVVSEP